MKSKISIGMLAICMLVTTALAAKTFSYVCMNPRCKSYKQVVTFVENEPNEHHCSVCKERLDQSK